ncbi:hypothetical protein FDP41_011465 [Naegleria fowleri]|uniref:Uncharacterized protein n=1 Tax=Naegleria fowleri TaxID=5763 RepID=A0A6A5CAY2_NAEFO|nr:uncharacterized protein FDP41_011465 [Naegleria fowleri]KAF0982535.1 hypothetical protein FDP41_011465 [Naegleria fowleri]
MTMSGWIQLVAGVVSALTSLYASHLHMIDYFLQCFGILIFAIFVLLLFSPLLVEETAKSSSNNPNHMETGTQEKDGNQVDVKNYQLLNSPLPDSTSSPSLAVNTSPNSPNESELKETTTEHCHCMESGLHFGITHNNIQTYFVELTKPIQSPNNNPNQNHNYNDPTNQPLQTKNNLFLISSC